MAQNPIAVLEFTPGGLHGTAMSASVGSAFWSQVKSSPGVMMGINCISTGVISCYDAAVTTGSAPLASSQATGTVSSAVSASLGGSNNNFFFSTSLTAAGGPIDLKYPCSNGVLVSVSGGVWAIRFN